MKYVFLFFICVLFAGCFNEGDCLISATNYMRIQFKKRKKTSADTVVSFAYNSIEIPEKNLVIRIRPGVSQLLLPLNPDISKTSTTFILHRINAADSTKRANDTIQVGYTTQVKVITKTCGAFTYYNDLKILKKTTTQDSVQIKSFSPNLWKNPTNPIITNYALNYQIFY